MNDNMDFEEYIRQGEPDKKEKASIWQTYLSKTVREHINPTDEWKEQPNLDTPASNEQAPYKYPTSTPQVQDKLHTDDPNILRIVQAVGAQELSVKEIMDKPRHPRQKYLLTDKGLTLYKKLLGE